ncbi:MAG: hypothetical protein Q9169_007857 [Polycauliona sp. 2 TL-2023]
MLKRSRYTDSQPWYLIFKKSKPTPVQKLGLFQVPAIRDKIYQSCLVNKNPTSLIIPESPSPEGNRLNADQIYSLGLTTEKDYYHPQLNSDVAASLLQLNSTIHAEAAPVFYGLNTFSFNDSDCWINLTKFEERLTEISRQSVRRVEVRVPEIDPQLKERSSECERGLISLDKFSALESLTVHAFFHIVTSEIGALLKIRASLPRGCRVVVAAYATPLYSDEDDGEYDARPLGISLGALDMMHRWEWTIKGDFEPIDHDHWLYDETK